MAVTGPTTDHDEIRGWAEMHQVVPAEVFPPIVDHIPMVLQLIRGEALTGRTDLRKITWEDFFERFDLLGLTCVYDDAGSGQNELLQIEGKSPFRNEEYQPVKAEN